MTGIEAVPLSRQEASAFVEKMHRHHAPAQRDKFRIGAVVGGKLVGVVQVGNPVARMLCDGYTLEVLRCCTDGTRNVCSFLYSRAARVAKEMGYRKIITYILETESGDSLKASGWFLEDDNCGGNSWDHPSRRRSLMPDQISIFPQKQKYPTCKKQRWAKALR